MSVEIPSKLEVLITKDDCAVIGTGYDYYSQLQMVVVYHAVSVPRHEIDPDFDFNLDIYKVYESYIGRVANKVESAHVPMLNLRIKLGAYHRPEDIRQYLNLEEE